MLSAETFLDVACKFLGLGLGSSLLQKRIDMKRCLVLPVRRYLSEQSIRFARHGLLRMLGPIFLALAQVGLLPQAGAAAPLAIWVELIGPGSAASIRAVVPAEADCPAVIADGAPIPMQVRADPGPLFPPGKTPRAQFPVRVCELIAPRGKTSMTLQGIPLPLPVADPQRIVVFGDTGCRMKYTRLQDCGERWDYPDRKARGRIPSRPGHPSWRLSLSGILYRQPGLSAAANGLRLENLEQRFFRAIKSPLRCGPLDHGARQPRDLRSRRRRLVPLPRPCACAARVHPNERILRC